MTNHNPNHHVGRGKNGNININIHDKDGDIHNHNPILADTYGDNVRHPSIPSTSTSRYQCHDSIWAILFIIHLVCVMGFGFHSISLYGTDIWYTYMNQENHQNITLFLLIIMIIGNGLTLSMFVFWLMKYRIHTFIQISFLSIPINIGVFIWMIYLHAMVGIIIMGIALVFNILWVRSARSRIPFVTTLFHISITMIQFYPTILKFTLFIIIIQIIWMIVWIISCTGIIWVLSSPQSISQPDGYILFVLLISFYWTIQVIKNINYTCITGVVGNWYYSTPTSIPLHPTLFSFHHVTSTSFGTICLGSLFIPIVTIIRIILQIMGNGDREKSGGACLACIADCILGCIESTITYINKYTFTHVGLYGKSYYSAARDTYQLLTQHGLDAVVHDSAFNGILWIGCCIPGLICLITMAIAIEFNEISNDVWIWSFASFWIGFILCACIMDMCEAIITTICVCLAQDPTVLAETKPEIYNRLISALENEYPDVLTWMMVL